MTVVDTIAILCVSSGILLIGYICWLTYREVRVRTDAVKALLERIWRRSDESPSSPESRQAFSEKEEGRIKSLLERIRRRRHESPGSPESRQALSEKEKERHDLDVLSIGSTAVPYRTTLTVLALALGLIILGGVLALVDEAEAGNETDEPQNNGVELPSPNAFDWFMDERIGDADHDGVVDYEDPDDANPVYWSVRFVASRPCLAAGSVRWTIDHSHIEGADDQCQFIFDFPEEGVYDVGLTFTSEDGARVESSNQVVVQDWLIVSLGDSVASGEGNPPWKGNAQCHRSAVAGPAVAARQIQAFDARTSVTYLHVACTGATIKEGLVGSQDERLPQVKQLDQIVDGREIDALLLSVGANDIGFNKIVKGCAKSIRHCKDSAAVREGLDLIDNALPRLYRDLASCLSSPFSEPASICRGVGSRNSGTLVPDPTRVFITEYFNPTRDSDGNLCQRILAFRPWGITKAELEWTEEFIIKPLNRRVELASSTAGWTYVGSIFDDFKTHGYCATKEGWIVKLPRALLKRNIIGALHPNANGHEAYGEHIFEPLVSALYPEEGSLPRRPGVPIP